MNEITNEQSEMIDYILSGKDMVSIARVMNKSRQTLYNWLRLEVVKAELERRKDELKSSARKRINSHALTSVENLIDMACNSKDLRVKFQANKYLIDQCLGSPSAAKEDNGVSDSNDNHKDENTLKKEIDDIKKIRAIK